MQFRFLTQGRIARLACAGALCGLPGCKDKSITSYRTQKEPDADTAPAVAATDAVAPAAGPAVRWVAPAAWKSQAASGMREGSYRVAGAGGASADVSIVSFPGAGGDELANINRWRGQLQLAPISAAELSGQVQSVVSAAGPVIMTDLAGGKGETGASRILGAWFKDANRVWFFKMMGPAELVEGQKDAFVTLLQSIRLAGEAAADPLTQTGGSQANTNDLPHSGGGMPPPVDSPAMDSIAVQAESGAALLWQAPPEWQSQADRPMRKASYATGGGAEVAITAFPGEVGGILANVNRWRGQAGLEPIDEAGLAGATTVVENQGLHVVVVDAEGGTSPIVAALVPWNGGTWFFKLTGSANAVARAKPAFLSFLRSVRAP